MLAEFNASPNLAVKDLAKARSFYEGVLGLTAVDEQGDEAVVYRAGKSLIIVYVSDYAGTNRATAVTWTLGERLEPIVNELVAKGVKFEHYDMPGMTRSGEIHSGWGMKTAWFKDPDGNIISLMSE